MDMNNEQIKEIMNCVIRMKDSSTDNPVIPVVDLKIMLKLQSMTVEDNAAQRTKNLERFKMLVCIFYNSNKFLNHLSKIF
jgi:hypothetical protein